MTDDRAESPAESLRSTRRLGVLLVHGIGEQRPGDTLLTAGGALHRWLQRWSVGHPSISTIGLTDVSLAASSRGIESSAHARLVVVGSDSRADWLLEESYWADAFYPPTFRELVQWCGRMLAWLPLMYFLVRLDDAWETMLSNSPLRRNIDPDGHAVGTTANAVQHDRAVARIWWLLLRLPVIGLLGPVVVAGLILVLILSFIPIGYVRSLTQSIQRVLSATIGDSYFYVTSPLTRVAIQTRVAKGIWALADRCDALVVVAHSQGAAVAYEVLSSMVRSDSLPRTVASLVTYGPGIQRLDAIERAIADPRRWTMFGLAIYAGLALIYGSTASAVTGRLSVGAALVVWVPTLLFVAAVLRTAAKRLNESTLVLPLPWTNLYSSHDPVAGGPMRVSVPGEQFLFADEPTQRELIGRVEAFTQRQREVINRRSEIGDHTAYWDAEDDFVALVAAELLSHSGHRLSDSDQFLVDLGRGRRRWRCAFLSRCRAMTFVAVLAACMSPHLLRTTAVWLSSWSAAQALLRACVTIK